MKTTIVVCFAAMMLASCDSPPPPDSDLRPAAARLPDAENAFPVFERMAAADPITSPEQGQKLNDLLKAPAGADPLAADLLARGTAEFTILDEFARRRAFQTPQDLDVASLGPDTPVPHFRPLMDAARLRSLRAAELLREGRADDALADALLIVDAGRVFLRSRGNLIEPLVGMMLVELGARRALETIASGRVRRAGLADASARLSVPAGSAALQEALRYEYVVQTRIVDLIPEKALHDPRYGAARRLLIYAMTRRGTYFYMPNRTKKLYADAFRGIIAAAGEPCLTAHWPKGDAPSYFLRPNMAGIVLYSIGIPQFEKLSTRRCEADFRLTAASVAAAAEAFRLDHGRRPATLAELTPAYLPSAPIDPFTGASPAYSAASGAISTPGLDADGKPLAL